MSVIRPAQLPVTPWKNGLGRKADIAVGDGWFVGLAWIEQDADFSDFTGFDRTCILLDGAGFGLSFDAGPALSFSAPGEVRSFPGDLPARAHLVAGPCRVLNVMTRRGQWEHRVTVGDRLPADGWAVVLRGTLRLEAGRDAGPDAGPGAGPGDVLVLPQAGLASPDLLLVTATVTAAARPAEPTR
jgi:hypothetical protein